MIVTFRQILRSTSASTVAEFGLVLPILLVMLFAVIDAGRFMYEYNQAEKATQVGARVAVVTSVLSNQLRDETYVGKTVGGKTIGAGDRIPAGALGSLKCTSVACSCETSPCPANVGVVNSAAFNVLLARMQQMFPRIAATNVEIRYRGSGFGYASNGSGGTAEAPEISPLVTVTLTGIDFQPLYYPVFKRLTIPMPSFSTTLSAEDVSGAFSN
jgi:Flp pilus assembly protein TadG